MTEGLTRLGIAWEEHHLQKLQLYLEELSLWNRRQSMVKASGDELIINHVLDSLSAVPLLHRLQPAALADIGSGAGFPGIPLAIFLDETSVTLIERSSKKAAFLKAAGALLGLSNLRVECVDVTRFRGTFPLITARACTAIESIFPVFCRITEPGGRILLYKGTASKVEAEMERVKQLYERWERIPIEVPLLERERNLVLVYPRTTV